MVFAIEQTWPCNKYYNQSLRISHCHILTDRINHCRLSHPTRWPQGAPHDTVAMTIPVCNNCFNILITNIKIDVYLIINCNWGKYLQFLWCFLDPPKSTKKLQQGNERWSNFDTDLISWTCAPYNLPFHSSLRCKHYIL